MGGSRQSQGLLDDRAGSFAQGIEAGLRQKGLELVRLSVLGEGGILHHVFPVWMPVRMPAGWCNFTR